MASGLNIVLVEDHDALREVTLTALRALGHDVVAVDSAEGLDELPGIEFVDVAILDLHLPGEDGISLARRLRAARPGLGIVMVTARVSANDRIEGFASGADIYLIKPSTPLEIDAAIRALGRRLQGRDAAASTYRLDVKALVVRGPAGDVALSAADCAILSGLARARGRRLESWQIAELLRRDLDTFSKAALEVQILRLRKKLVRAGAEGSSIKAVRGTGYQLCIPVAAE